MLAHIISIIIVQTWTFWLLYKQASPGLAMLPVQLQLTEYTRALSKKGQRDCCSHPLAPVSVCKSAKRSYSDVTSQWHLHQQLDFDSCLNHTSIYVDSV